MCTHGARGVAPAARAMRLIAHARDETPPLSCQSVVVTAQTTLKQALRDTFGPEVRRHGYKGSAPTWRKASAQGYWAIVNVQSASWSSSDRLRCVVNISVAPEPWLRWQSHLLGAAMPKNVTEPLGLFRDRVHPAGSAPGADTWWEVTDDASAALAVAGIAEQMGPDVWTQLDELLTRSGMLRAVRAKNLGHMRGEAHEVFFARAEALLLMDAGDRDRLDACLARALDGVIPSQRANAEEFDRWVRRQAAGRGLAAHLLMGHPHHESARQGDRDTHDGDPEGQHGRHAEAAPG